MNDMYYCLGCPGPISGGHRGGCPFCGSDNVVEAGYESESGKWLPLTESGRFRKGNWLKREAEREELEGYESAGELAEILEAERFSYDDDCEIYGNGREYGGSRYSYDDEEDLWDNEWEYEGE